MQFALSPVFWQGQWVQGKDLSAADLYRFWALNDGFFETMHYDGHQVLWAASHRLRFTNSLKALHLIFPEDVKPIFATGWTLPSHLNTPATLRLNCWRQGEGTYPSSCQASHWMLQVRPAVNPQFAQSVRCETLQPVHVQGSEGESTGKFPNQFYSKAAFGLPHEVEALLIRNHDSLIETPSANIFIRTQQGRWITPELGSGCLPGITRSRLLQIFRREGAEVTESKVTLTDLDEAETCWLTNTTYGIRAVERWQNRWFDPGPQETFRNLLYKDGIEDKSM